MTSKRRREFLLSSMSVVVAVGFVFANRKFPPVSDIEATGEQRELILVYREWVIQGLGDPRAYFDSMGIDLNDLNNIKAKIVNDFEKGSTFNIEGLVLSLSEAAIMASIGFILLNPNWEK